MNWYVVGKPLLIYLYFLYNRNDKGTVVNCTFTIIYISISMK